MTIAIAWTRTISGCEELVFVSDSRLSGDGTTFDACQKVMTLPRSDCAIAFAGYTGHAFPMMNQLSLAIASHAPLARRSMDLPALKSHAIKIFDGMSSEIRSSQLLSSPADTMPSAEFLFGGYSWVKKDFIIWKLSYSESLERFEAHPSNWLVRTPYQDRIAFRQSKNPKSGQRLGRIIFAGDQADLAKELVVEKLKEKAEPAVLDWEPFEVVRDMLRSEGHSETIGGAPQIVKVYQYSEAAVLPVLWPDSEFGRPHLQGRALLEYERTDHFVFDPDALVSEHYRTKLT